jgi:acyl-CoA dehydrogenase
MTWDFRTEPEFEEQLEWIRSVVREQIEPLDTVKHEMSRASYKQATLALRTEVKERGLWAAHLDPDLGGQGMGQVKLALMHEILGRTPSAPAIFGNQAPDSGNGELMAVGANDEQKERWLWPLLAGELTSSFSLTEPHNAGSDPTQITTAAVLDGDEYVINGHKWFASGASVADFVLAMVVTNPAAAPHERASMIVIERGTPGMHIVRDVYTMDHPYPGYHDQHGGGHAEIIFEDCRVPAAHLIGQPGEGFLLAQKRLNAGRIHHAMRWVGMCHRAFDMMCERHGDPGSSPAHPSCSMAVGHLWPGGHPASGCPNQVLGCRDPLQRDRPCHTGARRSRVLGRSPPRAHVPHGTKLPDLRWRRRGAQIIHRPAHPEGLPAYRRLAQRAHTDASG